MENLKKELLEEQIKIDFEKILTEVLGQEIEIEIEEIKNA